MCFFLVKTRIFLPFIQSIRYQFDLLSHFMVKSLFYIFSPMGGWLVYRIYESTETFQSLLDILEARYLFLNYFVLIVVGMKQLRFFHHHQIRINHLNTKLLRQHLNLPIPPESLYIIKYQEMTVAISISISISISIHLYRANSL